MSAGKEGISFLPTLLGKSQQHDFIVYASGQGPALVTVDGWKLRYINQPENFQLYDLKAGYRGENDLATDHPDLVDKLRQDLFALLAIMTTVMEHLKPIMQPILNHTPDSFYDGNGIL